MFDDEADTISVDPSADLPTPSPSDTFKTVDAFESTRPIDTIQNDQLLPIEEIEDTDILVVSKLIEDASVNPPKRAATNADWPPAPKGPADRIHRRAGMYKAISSITKLNALRRIGSSNS